MLNYFLLKPFAAFIPNFKVFAESQTQKLPRFELLYQWHYNPPQNRFGKVKKKSLKTGQHQKTLLSVLM